VLDPSKTEVDFGWKAQLGLEESLKRMIDWYNINGVRAVYAHLKAPTGHNS
jgi:UDP-glucose 4-epimerase